MYGEWPELGVHTKFGKKATTFILPIPHLIDVVSAWDELVRANLPPDYPWYAPIEQRWGEQKFTQELPGKNRHQALEKRLRLLFSLAGLPYKSAHKFRHGHAVFGIDACSNHGRLQSSFSQPDARLVDCY